MSETWTALQRRLHWIVAGIVLVQFLLQAPMESAAAAGVRGENIGFIDFLVTTVHSVGGVTIAVLVGVRLMLRQRAPVKVAGGLYGPRVAALIECNHLLLYALLLVMALTGSLQYYLAIDAAQRWHEVGKWLLAGSIVLHVIGALWHYRHSID